MPGPILPSAQFASDNAAGICPEAWRALEAANRGHALAYGDDAWTAQACELLRGTFERDCDVYFVYTGTAANALALAALGRSYHAVICHELSHLEQGECGASAFFASGLTLLPLPGSLGKLRAEAVEIAVQANQHPHAPRPRALSVTQATELGTVYSVDELGAVGETAKRLGLGFHLDGARFSNAVAALGKTPAELTWRAGVDVLSLGGTKNGGLMGEAIIFFDRELGTEFAYRCKQAGQLGSKLRFLAAPWIGMLEGGAWLRHATQANAMARLLHEELATVPDVKLLFPVETNAVFADIPERALSALRRLGWTIPGIFGETGCRLMCAWSTTPEDVRVFVDCLRRVLQSDGRPAT